MLLSEEALHGQDPVLYGTPGLWLWSVCPSLKRSPPRRSVVGPPGRGGTHPQYAKGLQNVQGQGTTSDFRCPLKCCNFNTLHFGLSQR